jgi:hypothetical protein
MTQPEPLKGSEAWCTNTQSTYRVKIKTSGTPPNESYAWEIFRNLDVLPLLRSKELFVSRAEGLADANQSRLRLVEAARRP